MGCQPSHHALFWCGGSASSPLGYLAGSKGKMQSTSKLQHVLLERGFPMAAAPEKCPTVFLCCP